MYALCLVVGRTSVYEETGNGAHLSISLSQQRQQQVLVRFGTTQPEANPWGGGIKKNILARFTELSAAGASAAFPACHGFLSLWTRHGQKADEVPIV